MKINYLLSLFFALLLVSSGLAEPEKSDDWLDMDIRVLESEKSTDWYVRVWITSNLPEMAEVNFKIISIYPDGSEGTTKEYTRIVYPTEQLGGPQMTHFDLFVTEEEKKNDVDVEATYGNHYYRDGINTLLRISHRQLNPEQEEDVRAQAEKKLAEMGLDAKGNPLPEQQEDSKQKAEKTLADLGLDKQGNALPKEKIDYVRVLGIAAVIAVSLLIVVMVFKMIKRPRQLKP